MRKLIAAILPILLLLAFSGCIHRHGALQVSAGVAASITAMQDGEIGLHKAKLVTDAEHVTLQKGFKLLFQEDKTVRQCIYDTNVPTCVDSGITAVNSFLASDVNGIKNPDSQTQVRLLAQAVITALTNLKAGL